MITKKIFYIFSFTVFGILLQFLLHEIIEIWYINLLISDFPKYSLGFSWEKWFIIHHVATVIFFIVGAFFGFWQGKYWWVRLYEKNFNALHRAKK